MRVLSNDKSTIWLSLTQHGNMTDLMQCSRKWSLPHPLVVCAADFDVVDLWALAFIPGSSGGLQR